jgi:hypothetical protein
MAMAITNNLDLPSVAPRAIVFCSIQQGFDKEARILLRSPRVFQLLTNVQLLTSRWVDIGTIVRLNLHC